MSNNLKEINGKILYAGIVSGIKNLIQYKDKLDEINVFPIPDGDTGTNMSFTLLPIIEECSSSINSNISDVVNIIADSALDSARGNSGTIIAQFFHGMRKSLRGLKKANINDFSVALQVGYQCAEESLLKPEEGTIITVMRDVAITANDLIKQENMDFIILLHGCYESAEVSLQRTKTILKILQKTGVVDAGALGFVLIIQGMLNSIQKDSRIQSTHLNITYKLEKVEALKKGIDFIINNKFCTECSITGEDINKDQLKQVIKHCGDSLVIAGTRNKVKVHIHTNDPGRLFQICNVYGNIINKKVDDMTKQEHSIRHEGASSIAIVVDSGGDLPEDYLKEVQVVPVRYSFGSQQHIDGVTQSKQDFYRQMATDSNHPKTSQPTPGDFRKTYNFISSHYNHIISIHLSKLTSGTYQSALNASKKIKIENIKIIDSHSASVGLGLLVMYAVDLKQQGKSFKEIVSLVNKKRFKVEVYLAIDDLTYIVRGGRLSSNIKSIANILRLRPILGTKKGKITARGVLYGKSNTVAKFTKFLDKKIKIEKKYKLLIAHSNCREKGQRLLDQLIAENPNIIEHYLLELGGALGAHAGPNSLAVGLEEID